MAGLLRISPTPVREALRRLEQDRLIERLGPRSVRIANYDDGEIADISAIENVLRALAARLAATRATDVQLAAMQAALDAADAERKRLPQIGAVRGRG